MIISVTQSISDVTWNELPHLSEPLVPIYNMGIKMYILQKSRKWHYI